MFSKKNLANFFRFFKWEASDRIATAPLWCPLKLFDATLPPDHEKISFLNIQLFLPWSAFEFLLYKETNCEVL